MSGTMMKSRTMWEISTVDLQILFYSIACTSQLEAMVYQKKTVQCGWRQCEFLYFSVNVHLNVVYGLFRREDSTVSW